MGQPQSHSTAPAHLAARWQKRQSTARTRDLQPPQRDWQQSLQQHNIITATNNANAEKRKFKFGQNNTKTKTSRNSSCAVFVVVVVLILKPPVRQTILLCHWHYIKSHVTFLLQLLLLLLTNMPLPQQLSNDGFVCLFACWL